MMRLLVLRLDAPLMSFGGPRVDQVGATLDFPGRSMLTGLIANALGWTHGEFDKLGALQSRIRYAVREDVKGSTQVDFHTVDLGQPHMIGTGWTTHGSVESRGGASGTSTHIREQHYLVDALYTVALTLDPAELSPTLDEVAEAIRCPARPLFLGRKCCLPSSPLLVNIEEHHSFLEALSQIAVPKRAQGTKTVRAWWPNEESGSGMTIPVVDDRDWANQIHVGRRFFKEGVVPLPETGVSRD